VLATAVTLASLPAQAGVLGVERLYRAELSPDGALRVCVSLRSDTGSGYATLVVPADATTGARLDKGCGGRGGRSLLLERSTPGSVEIAGAELVYHPLDGRRAVVVPLNRLDAALARPDSRSAPYPPAASGSSRDAKSSRDPAWAQAGRDPAAAELPRGSLAPEAQAEKPARITPLGVVASLVLLPPLAVAFVALYVPVRIVEWAVSGIDLRC